MTDSGAPATPVGSASRPTQPGHQPDVHHGGGSPMAPLVAGVVMLALGAALLRETFAIRGEGFAPDGPRFLPLVVVALWTVLALVYLGQQLVAMARKRGTLPSERFAHLGGLAALVVLLVVYAYALDPVGYLLATSVFFVAAARALGSRQLRRDVVVGVALTLVVYLLFTNGLGVHLPQGVLPL